MSEEKESRESEKYIEEQESRESVKEITEKFKNSKLEFHGNSEESVVKKMSDENQNNEVKEYPEAKEAFRKISR